MNILCNESEIHLKEDIDFSHATSSAFKIVYLSMDNAQKEEVENFLLTKFKEGKEINYITYINLFNNYANKNGFPFYWYIDTNNNGSFRTLTLEPTHECHGEVDENKLEDLFNVLAKFVDGFCYFGWFDEDFEAHSYILNDGHVEKEYIEVDFLAGRL